jgi:hypothetical protein
MRKKIAYQQTQDGPTLYWQPWSKMQLLEYLAKYVPNLVGDPSFNPNQSCKKLEELLDDHVERQIIGLDNWGRTVSGPILWLLKLGQLTGAI